jgi:hypothetical protein
MNIRRCRRDGNRAVVLGTSGLLVLASCAAVFATRIADIQNAPTKYDGREVTVAGKVTSAHNLLVVKYYEVDDGTGEIPVVTQSELPKKGDKVRVKGRVNQAFVLGTAHLVVIVEEPPSR